MASLLDRGRAMLARNLKSAAGVTATYSRGGSSVTLTAWVGNTLFKMQDSTGLRIMWGERDYLIKASDLVLNGNSVEPAENDRISETINGETMTFEVFPVSPGEPAWRWSDPSQTIFRIHVKRVA